ncbi:MAG: isocitrate lyase/phosphoenolpyruvate mutase family protein [Candidatus Eisenbacteria bacterium]|nr:isocitrate lyase/phosphoenolpyruvate mutase family protein [Candidatus Eisenbacteria bacterium]MCC7143580.1 isocitrate lyase/phosphoenolpyruvate mutase family protein [Candidatus Eisenbacteria bacterium]
MSNTSEHQRGARAAFRALHDSGCFLLPNPWDIGTARYLEHLGFAAIATTSAGFAFSRGLPDDPACVTLDLALGHAREMAAAISLPVNVDFQSGYADEPAGVAENVTRCIATGVAGLSIEDATGRSEAPLYEAKLAIERIEAALSAIDSEVEDRVMLTARCEAYLVGHADPFRVVIERLTAFAAAGADCLYAPGVTDPTEIEAIVRAVAPKPVNVLVWKPLPGLSMTRLADLGVRRVSVGGALARMAWGGFIRAAESLRSTGDFGVFGDAARSDSIERVFRER